MRKHERVWVCNSKTGICREANPMRWNVILAVREIAQRTRRLLYRREALARISEINDMPAGRTMNALVQKNLKPSGNFSSFQPFSTIPIAFSTIKRCLLKRGFLWESRSPGFEFEGHGENYLFEVFIPGEPWYCEPFGEHAAQIDDKLWTVIRGWGETEELAGCRAAIKAVWAEELAKKVIRGRKD
jgi:hypothetical protein